uniref:Uncharacterized protein n=1 Tax=Arion vulgaris TaxID=1028688 RepID=A0A0B7B0N2_9EUPU
MHLWSDIPEEEDTAVASFNNFARRPTVQINIMQLANWNTLHLFCQDSPKEEDTADVDTHYQKKHCSCQIGIQCCFGKISH